MMRESIVTTSEGTYAELKRLLRAEGLFRSQWRYYAMKSSMTIGTLAVLVAPSGVRQAAAMISSSKSILISPASSTISSTKLSSFFA